MVSESPRAEKALSKNSVQKRTADRFAGVSRIEGIRGVVTGVAAGA